MGYSEELVSDSLGGRMNRLKDFEGGGAWDSGEFDSGSVDGV